ncbi:MAG: hypothetical protein ACE5E7_02205 [Anaerolineae bacterium]
MRIKPALWRMTYLVVMCALAAACTPTLAETPENPTDPLTTNLPLEGSEASTTTKNPVSTAKAPFPVTPADLDGVLGVQSMETTPMPQPDMGALSTNTVDTVPSQGGVPDDILAAVLDDFASRSGLSSEEATIVQAEAVTWQNSALGCPEKGQIYLQVMVQGYQIVIEGGSQTYDYRVNENGSIRLCTNAAPSLP